MQRAFLFLALGACSPAPTDDTDGACPDTDADGVCDADDACEGVDDAQDEDADGVPDACEIDLLGGLGDASTHLDTSSTHLAVQLAYDTHLALSQWLIFEPGLVVSEAEPVAAAWTRDLGGWDAIQERLTDGADEDFCTYVTGQEDGFHQALTQREDFYDLTGLVGAEVNQVVIEAADWHQEDDMEVVAFLWSFLGYVP